MTKSVFIEKKNCWRKTEIGQISLLIDANNYYKAFFDVAARARRSILIAGWDVDARIGLKSVNKAYPDNLREYFKNLIKKTKNLRISVFSWKPALYLKFDREFFAPTKWKKTGVEKLNYRQDKPPFAFGSYHEKVSIVDAECAFLGGIDLTNNRWDTQEHAEHNKKRTGAHGEFYCPVHDLQLVVTGKVVDDLNDALKRRTRRRGSKKPQEEKSQRKTGHPLWPRTHEPELAHARAAIARTEALEQAREIENFYLDAISSAKEYIFIENQYLSHDLIVEALCSKLREEEGPEVIITLPLFYPGFFERAIFIKTRNGVIQRMKQADLHGRLGIFYPSLPNESRANYIVVHSKLLVVDSNLMTLGSANLNWRSMRVDSEINLCLEADKDLKTREFIQQIPERLLAEHLAVTPGQFSKEARARGSLLAAINLFKGKNSKSLKDLPREKRTFFESCFGFLKPFVDIKKPIPQKLFNLGLALALLFFFFSLRAFYEF